MMKYLSRLRVLRLTWCKQTNLNSVPYDTRKEWCVDIELSAVPFFLPLQCRHWPPPTRPLILLFLFWFPSRVARVPRATNEKSNFDQSNHFLGPLWPPSPVMFSRLSLQQKWARPRAWWRHPPSPSLPGLVLCRLSRLVLAPSWIRPPHVYQRSHLLLLPSFAHGFDNIWCILNHWNILTRLSCFF